MEVERRARQDGTQIEEYEPREEQARKRGCNPSGGCGEGSGTGAALRCGCCCRHSLQTLRAEQTAVVFRRALAAEEALARRTAYGGFTPGVSEASLLRERIGDYWRDSGPPLGAMGSLTGFRVQT